jgi:hypothetical protein
MKPFPKLIANPLPSAAQLRQQRVDLVGRHQAAHPLVVDEEHRRVAARAEALALLQRHEAVRRRLAEADAELGLEVLRGLDASCRAHGRLVQIVILYLPTGWVLYIA